jgi:hypothetical protein
MKINLPSGGGVEAPADEIVRVWNALKKSFRTVARWIKRHFLYRRIPQWHAKCVERVGWSQKSAAKPINLKGRYLSSATFRIKPLTTYWRAGIIIGNDKYSSGQVTDNLNAITCHLGSSEIEDGVPVWVYDAKHTRNNPYSVIIPTDNTSEFAVRAEINDKNFLTLFVESEPVYSRRIDSTLRKKPGAMIKTVK